MTLFSGLGTDVHFFGDETGLQWEDYLFELQNAVEWRVVMSRGQDEAISDARHECVAQYVQWTNRVLIDDGTRWTLHGDEQERENRTAGVKALCSMLAATTSVVPCKGARETRGSVNGTARSRLEGYASDSARLLEWRSSQTCFSSSGLEDKSLRWQKLMRQVNMTSLGDDARETLTIACLEKAKERSLEQHLRLRAPQTWISNWRTTVDSGSQPTPMEIGTVMSTCALLWQAGHEKARYNVRNLLASQAPRAAVARVLAQAAQVVEAQTSAIVVDRSVIE